MKKKILFIIALGALSFPQIRVSIELDGKINDITTHPALTLGYDHMLWKQNSLSSGIGIETMINKFIKPDLYYGANCSTIYFIVKYGLDETWGAYSKFGISRIEDHEDLYFGMGIYRNFDDEYYIETGFHSSYLDGYDYSRIVISIIK